MLRRLCVLIVAVTPVAALAASKEIMELQRDVALLQESVKQLQQSQDRQLAALLEAVRLAQDTSGKSNTSLAVMERTLQQSLQDMQAKVMQPVAGLSARMDGVSNDVRSLQQAVTDLTASMEKIQSQLTDLNNAVKLMQTPAAAPPGQGGIPPGGAPGMNAGGAPMAAQTPCMPLGDLYQSADRDRTAGKLELALTEFQDFLRCYGNTDRAPNAQYYIGWIHYSQGDYPSALKDFDAVLEKYPDNNNKKADAFYYKGMTLTKMSQRTAASEEFIQLIQQFPSSPLASQACTQLREMGKNCPTAANRSSAGKKKKGE
ncbi:MAG TPA: tetratricopeptide repeat protein [Bryobacteraceae bacterium]|nr:tetratricopeptide repeat protein [Bryobacteraceae bacterium]